MIKEKSKFNKFVKIARPLAILLAMILILTAASVAWVRREWAPYLSSGQNGISIAKQDALVFNMESDDGDQEISSSKTINAVLGIDHFELKPVSCAAHINGDFYKINYNSSPSEYEFQKVIESTTPMQTGINNGYIDIIFTVAGNSDVKADALHVYLHEESHIGTPGEALKDSDKAIRVAITAGTTKYIFSAEGQDRLTNVNEQTTYKAINSIGKVYSSYDETTGTGVRNQACVTDLTSHVKKFSDYNGVDADNNKDKTKCLFSVPSTGAVDVRVQIWLEGEDEHCTEKILSENLDILIKFAAFTLDEA